MMPLKENTKMSDLFSGNRFQVFLDSIAEIESKGVYDISGGTNDHYDGKYQLGKAAKKDAGELLGVDLEHTKSAREAFRKDPELQEQAMKALVMRNHQALINKQGEAYTSLPDEEKLAVLGYAHNQGAGGASKWMRTGRVEKDGFGTKGTKYSESIRSNLGNHGFYGVGEMLEHEGEQFMSLATDATDKVVSLYDDAMNWVGGLFGVDDVDPTPHEMYTVQSTDSDGLGMIAQRAGIPFRTVMELNPDMDYGRIQVGQQVRLR
jgi:hypothetical protein